MKRKRIFILLGHPNKDTLNGKMAESYEKSAFSAGHDVRRVNIGDMKFDPILHKGYKEIQELEPDLKKVQENMRWCDHFVLFYPNWWITMPALLKGLFDRMWLPGFAFKFKSIGWEKLLKGRSARVIITMNSMPILERILLGDFTNEIRRGILGFAGFKVKISKIGPVEGISEKKVSKILKKVEYLAKRAK